MKESSGKVRNAAASLIDDVEKLKKLRVAKAKLKGKISYGQSKIKRYESESPTEGQD